MCTCTAASHTVLAEVLSEKVFGAVTMRKIMVGPSCHNLHETVNPFGASNLISILKKGGQQELVHTQHPRKLAKLHHCKKCSKENCRSGQCWRLLELTQTTGHGRRQQKHIYIIKNTCQGRTKHWALYMCERISVWILKSTKVRSLSWWIAMSLFSTSSSRRKCFR